MPAQPGQGPARDDPAVPVYHRRGGFTPNQIADIVHRAQGEVQWTIALRYGVSQSTISRLLKRVRLGLLAAPGASAGADHDARPDTVGTPDEGERTGAGPPT